MAQILFSTAHRVAHDPVAADQVVEGDPAVAVWQVPVHSIECGIWEHTAGVSTDMETHEVFVVLSGRATIEVEGAEQIEVGPGDVVELVAGDVTRWHVHETLRKFWVAVPD